MRSRSIDIAVAVLAIGQLVASAWLVPTGDRIAFPGGAELGDLCWFHATFHLPCPLCGMTRSFVAFAHGDVAAALRFHPGGPLLFTAMLAFAVAATIAWLRHTPPMIERRGFMRGFETVVAVCLLIGLFRIMGS
jgi:Protein of unknown function (DUF2752)